MTIKSDRWIRKMAEAGMIEPFEPDQIRHSAGNRVISYGTSSYGYDVRCAPEFKVFTNNPLGDGGSEEFRCPELRRHP